MMTPSIMTALVWGTLLIVPPVGGYWLARVRAPMLRTALLSLFLLTPVWALTILMVATPPAPPSSFSWWVAGLIMIIPAIAIWGMLAGAGYAISRRNAR